MSHVKIRSLTDSSTLETIFKHNNSYKNTTTDVLNISYQRFYTVFCVILYKNTLIKQQKQLFYVIYMSYIKVNVQDLNISIKVHNKIGKVSYIKLIRPETFYAFTITLLAKQKLKST